MNIIGMAIYIAILVGLYATVLSLFLSGNWVVGLMMLFPTLFVTMPAIIDIQEKL